MTICKRCNMEDDEPKYKKVYKRASKLYKKKKKTEMKDIKEVFYSIGDGIEGKGY